MQRLLFLLDNRPSHRSSRFSTYTMENGGVDRTVKDCRQNQMGQMADFPPLFLLFEFLTFKLDVPQIKFQTMRHTRMN